MSTPLLTAHVVADMLNVSAETILRWVRCGELPAIRLPGGAIRFREAELEDWIGERATPRRGVLTTTTDAARQQTVASLSLTTTEGEEDR